VFVGFPSFTTTQLLHPHNQWLWGGNDVFGFPLIHNNAVDPSPQPVVVGRKRGFWGRNEGKLRSQNRLYSPQTPFVGMNQAWFSNNLGPGKLTEFPKDLFQRGRGS